MNTNNFAGRCLAAISMAFRYWVEQAILFEAMDKLYVREWTEEGTIGLLSSTIRVRTCGHIYYVGQTFYFNNSYYRHLNWMATYTNSSCLVPIEVNKYLYFDPSQKTLYLEERQDCGERTVEVYKQFQKPKP